MIAPQVFADGIGAIAVAGGVVRIDFVALTQGRGASAATEPCQRVIMSIEGFASAYRTMTRMIESLAAQGLISIERATPQDPRTPPSTGQEESP